MNASSLRPTPPRTCRALLQHIGILWISLAAIWMSCGTAGRGRSSGAPDITRVWQGLDIADKYHTGLAVYDAQAGKWLFRHRADNLFTPASNTKLLTLKAALDILPEVLTAACYVRQGDSLVVWGGGDPGTWYPDEEAPSPLVEFLSSQPEEIYLSTGHFQTTRYGPGWAWDDFAYAFQAERTAMPVHGNQLWIERRGDRWRVAPSYLDPLVDIRAGETTFYGRTEAGDRYWYIYDPSVGEETIHMPLSFWGNDLARIWSHYTGKTIRPTNAPLPPEYRRIAGSHRDSLLKVMMQESDNFVAEQILLAAAFQATGVMNEGLIIDSLRRTSFAPIADDIHWVDGSGLSRYNLATPEAVIWVLKEVLVDQGIGYIQAIFAAGGSSGNLAVMYGGKNGIPYVYAKTGTLSHHHNLSGYLVTRSGRILLISWMHSLFPGPTQQVRRDMEKMLTFLHANY